ncbi:MAG: hypothetical protein CVV34_06090 [Methanomicrobiales archaeon HGW-Methanomicrobiales-5]|nr:MAG: hypothetical protein CVV34_06090 [Methanomicrobiales archaeon HGW-Methanomicrobiales-5]
MDDNLPEPVVTPRKPAATVPLQKPVKKGLFSRLFAPKKRSSPSLKPASMPVSPPPQKPGRASRMPGKKVFIAIGVIILLLAIVGVGVVFVYPMISGSESSIPGLPTGIPGATSTPATTSNPVASGTFVVPVETTAPAAPATGVYAHISYIGSWKATYGMPAALQTSTDSGDRFLEIENATGPVEVTAEKLDSSTRHELLVEIYKNGGLLSSGKTSAGFGKVTVSADATTGVGQASKVVSGNVTTTTKPVTNVTTVKTTSASATTVSTVKTTAPVATTKTASP